MNIARTLVTLLVLLSLHPLAAQSEIPATFTPTNDAFDHVRREAGIPMRDGVTLHTVILVPNGAKRAPMLLTRTPYNADALTSHLPSSQLGPSLFGYDNATDVIVEGGYIRLGRAAHYVLAQTRHKPDKPDIAEGRRTRQEPDKPDNNATGQGSQRTQRARTPRKDRKCARIAELRAAGLAPRVDILAHALRDEETAFRIEAAVIDLFGLDALTNQVRGWRSLQLGRIPLSELVTYYAATKVDMTVSALLIRINRLYRHNMSAQELYETTRGVWKLGARCAKARYAFAVFEGVVREVYEIESWHPAATTPYVTRDAAQLTTAGRREFIGHVAETAIRDAYVGRSVADEFKRGLQSPVVHVNC